MMTIRQIERLWNAADYARLSGELLQGRPESSVRALVDAAHRVPAAALALIRIDEFAQSAHPLCQPLIRCLVAGQDKDGGWGDAGTTALVIRALSLSRGMGVAIERGVAFLGMLQREEGLWSRIPLRRTEGDVETTAVVLHHLARVAAVRGVLDLEGARRAVVGSVEGKQFAHLTRGLPAFPAVESRPAVAGKLGGGALFAAA